MTSKLKTKWYCPKETKMVFVCEELTTDHPICQGCHSQKTVKDNICPYWITKEERCKGVSNPLPNFVCPRYGDYKTCGRYTLIIDLEYRKYEHARIVFQK